MENSSCIPFEELNIRMLEQERDKSIKRLRKRSIFRESDTDNSSCIPFEDVNIRMLEQEKEKSIRGLRRSVFREADTEKDKVSSRGNSWGPKKNEKEKKQEEEKKEETEEEEEVEQEEDEDTQGLVGEDLQRYRCLKQYFKNLAQATMNWGK